MKLSLFALLSVLALASIGYQNCSKSDFQAVTDEADLNSSETCTLTAGNCNPPLVPTPIPTPTFYETPNFICPIGLKPAKLVYDSVSRHYRNAFDGAKVGMGDGIRVARPTSFTKYDAPTLEGRNGNFEVNDLESTSGSAYLSLLINGNVKKVTQCTNCLFIGKGNSAQIQTISVANNIHLWGPLKINFASGSHIYVHDGVGIARVEAAQLYADATSAKNLMNTEICASNILIRD